MTLLLRIGEVLLESSVAVSDVDQSIRRMADALGLEHLQVSVTLNVITLSYLDTAPGEPVTLLTTVDDHEPRLHQLAAAEDLSRRVEAGEVGIDAAYHEALAIETAPNPYPTWVRVGAALVSVAGWSVFAGGALAAAVAVMAAWAVIVPLLAFWRRSRMPDIFGTLAAAFLVVAVAYAAEWIGFGVRAQAAVAGGIYPLLPGGLLVASVVDGLFGAPISSLAKGLQAVVVAAAIALGVVLALQAADALEVVPTAAAEPWPIAVTTVAAGIALAGQALARAAPWRAVAISAGIGMAVWLVAWVGPHYDVGRELTTFLAAGVLGVAGNLVARLERTTATLYTSTAVYVLVPGIAIYLAMVALTGGEEALAQELFEQAVKVSIAIAAGIALGSAVAASVPSPRRHIKLWRHGPTRHGE